VKTLVVLLFFNALNKDNHLMEQDTGSSVVIYKFACVIVVNAFIIKKSKTLKRVLKINNVKNFSYP